MKLLIFIPLMFILLSCSEQENRQSKSDRHKRAEHQNADDENTSWNFVNFNQKVHVNFQDPDGVLVYISKRNVHRVIQPICRGMNGCLQVCDYLQEPRCKQSSITEVAHLWLKKITEHTDWEQARDALDLIAKKSDIATFLKAADENNQIARTLFHAYSSADCLLKNKQSMSYSYTPKASLYLNRQESDDASATSDVVAVDSNAAAGNAATSTQVEVQDDAESEALTEDETPSNIKKIIDGNLVPFDLQLFTSFIKQCFGYNSRTFMEIAATIENMEALNLGHELISEACNKNDDCIRLAYCEIDSPSVWQKVGPDMESLGCGFDNFSQFTDSNLN